MSHEGNLNTGRNSLAHDGWRRLARSARALLPSSEFALLTVCCVLAIGTVALMIVHRSIHGGPDWILAGHFGLFGLFSAVLTFLWWTRRVQAAAAALAGIASGAVIVAMLLHPLGASENWGLLLPVIMVNFFITHERLAFALGTAMVATMIFSLSQSGGGPEMGSRLAAAIHVFLLSFLFSRHASRQQQQLGVLARRDPLTGTGNRRALQFELQARVAARRIGEPCGLVLMDIDNFKSLNDSFGHEYGDRVLVLLVESVKATLRASDRIYRFGGDEFAVVLPATSREGMAGALTKLYASLEQYSRFHGCMVTVSAGAACLAHEEDIDSWLRRADQALYLAKAAGRNCFWIDERVPPDTADATSSPTVSSKGSPPVTRPDEDHGRRRGQADNHSS